MSRSETDPIDYHLRRLDGDALAAFVADLWAARGYETAREGDVVVAAHGEGAVHIRIPRAGGRATADPADVVIAPGGGDYGDARVVDAAALREMLAYAVDRGVAQELCERHLGAPPAELRPGPLARAKGHSGRLLGGETPALLLATFAVVFALGAVAWFGAFPLSVGADTAPATGQLTAPETPELVASEGGQETWEERAESRSGEEAFPSSSTTPPPGVNESAVTDLDALARAHERALADRSHTVWIDRDGPANLSANGSRIGREINMAVEGDRYLITTTAESNTSQRLGAVYHDGTVPYAALWNETAERYDRVFQIDPRHDLSPTPETVRKTVVEHYLSTSRTRVTGRAALDGSTAYRVVGRGAPNSSAFESVEYYRVVALVDARGFVHDITVEYLETSDDDAYWVREEVTYGRIGSTTVETPRWYERQVDGNASSD